MTPFMLLFVLLGAHSFFDYAGQGDFMAKAKNASAPIPGVPFWHALISHSVIQGAAVAFITGLPVLGIAEMVIHGITDHLKCLGKISFTTDQAIHVLCKVAWVIAATVYFS